MGRRITRKQLKQQDEFITFADTVMQWLTGNWRPIVLVAGTAATIYLIWGLATYWSDSRSSDAAVQLNAAIEQLNGEEEPAVTPAAADKSATDDSAEPADGEQLLRAVVDDHGGTTQGDIARLLLARRELERGEQDEARALLVKLAEQHHGDTLGRVAIYDLIRLRLATGQQEEVANELLAMASGEDDRLPRDLALWELASLHEQEDPAKAKEYLQKIVDEFPQSTFEQAATRKLSALG